jgi:hypothetical protein
MVVVVRHKNQDVAITTATCRSQNSSNLSLRSDHWGAFVVIRYHRASYGGRVGLVTNSPPTRIFYFFWHTKKQLYFPAENNSTTPQHRNGAGEKKEKKEKKK